MSVLDFVISNYRIFLSIAIAIMFSIIGYYAEKTNFGQGNSKSNDQEKEKINLDDKKLADFLGVKTNKKVTIDDITPEMLDKLMTETSQEKNGSVGSSSTNIDSINVTDNQIKSKTNLNDNMIKEETNTVKKLEKEPSSDEEILSLLEPESESVIDEDLISEIDDMNLDNIKIENKNKKRLYELNNYDIELPLFDSLRSDDSNTDIWNIKKS